MKKKELLALEAEQNQIFERRKKILSLAKKSKPKTID